MYVVRKSVPGDLDAICAIFDSARAFMRSYGNNRQWLTNPTARMVLRDIENGESYVLTEDGKVIGTFMFTLRGEPAYDRIDGQWLNDRPYGTIHRIAGDGKHRGILASTVEYCSRFTDELRLDTHEDNHPMQKAAQALGFVRCGTVWVRDEFSDSSPRIAYHRSAGEG